MTRTSSPILWYGDLVDFGAFDTSLTRHSADSTISFHFEATDVQMRGEQVFFADDHFYYYPDMGSERAIESATLSISIKKSADRVRISKAVYSIPQQGIVASAIVDDNGRIDLLVNDKKISIPSDNVRLTISNGSIFPDFRYLRDRASGTTSTPRLIEFSAPFAQTLQKFLRARVSKRVSDHSVSEFTSKLINLASPSDEEILRASKSSGATIFKSMSKILESSPEEKKHLYDFVYASWFPRAAKAIGNHLREVFSTTLYIGPMRARSERYYRYQELAVSEIDPDGKNFPMFLNSISRKQLDDFSAWVEKLFGYGVTLSRQSGHISINLKNGAQETNIVDVGYGVSQILPVLGQIWWAKARPALKREKNRLSLLAIEQPELHLHPAHQALLADALVGETTESNAAERMHYVVETHSETLINRIGEFIAERRISADDVQVVIFDASSDERSSVRTVQFDHEGVLINWPFGFFQPSMLA